VVLRTQLLTRGAVAMGIWIGHAAERRLVIST